MKDIEITIYISSGAHFLFSCNADIKRSTAAPATLVDLCGVDSSYNFNDAYSENLLTYVPKSDRIKYYIKPLDCNVDDTTFATLGLLDRTDATFTGFCTDISAGAKPYIYVNQENFVFNITRYAKFEYLLFSGINMAANGNVNDTVSQYPDVLCNVATTPNGKEYYSTLDLYLVQSNYGIEYTCDDLY